MPLREYITNIITKKQEMLHSASLVTKLNVLENMSEEEKWWAALYFSLHFTTPSLNKICFRQATIRWDIVDRLLAGNEVVESNKERFTLEETIQNIIK